MIFQLCYTHTHTHTHTRARGGREKEGEGWGKHNLLYSYIVKCHHFKHLSNSINFLKYVTIMIP